MKITRNNYEAYFLDYLDGNLDNNLVDEFIEFLQSNPDLKEELHLAGTVALEPDTNLFYNKEKLYKEKYDTVEEFNKAAIGFIEGDLSTKEKSAFENYLSSHPEKLPDFELFQKTKLTPDKRIVFKNKNQLFRSSRGKTILLWVSRIAAILIISFLTYRYAGEVLTNKFQTGTQLIITENKKETGNTEKNIPEKAEEEKEQIRVQDDVSGPAKKTDNKEQKKRSLRESNNGRIDHEKVAASRIPAEVPDMIPSVKASLQNEEVLVASLVPIKQPGINDSSIEYEERLLADVVKEKTGLDNLSLNKVAKAGLSLVSGFSREKLNYETNSDGKITEINFDSRLLAFSIPTNPN